MNDVVVQHVRFDIEINSTLEYTNNLITQILHIKCKRLKLFLLMNKRSNPLSKFAGSSRHSSEGACREREKERGGKASSKG